MTRHMWQFGDLDALKQPTSCNPHVITTLQRRHPVNEIESIRIAVYLINASLLGDEDRPRLDFQRIKTC